MSSYPFDEPSFEEQNQRAPTGTTDQQPWLGQQPPAEPSILPPPPAAPPDMDLVDDTDRLEVFLDLPGFSEDDIDLRGDETHLVIAGERQSDIEDGQHILFQERPNRVERTVQLPVPVDISDAEADFEDGVCRVVLPKTAAEQYRQIKFR